MKRYCKYFVALFSLVLSVSCAQAQPQTESVKSNHVQSEPEVVLTTGHNDQINDVAISNDGKFFASGANNKIIKIWDVATSREYRTLTECDGRIVRVKWSPDNIHVGAVLYSDEIKIWNVLTGDVVKTVSASSSSRNFDFVNDGKDLVYLNGDNHFCRTSIFADGPITENKEVYGMTINTSENEGVSYLLDHKGVFHSLDVKNGGLLKSWPIFKEMNFPFTKTVFDDEKGLLACGFNDDMLYVIDPEKEKIVFKSKKYSGKIQDVVFHSKKPIIYASDHLGKVQGFNYNSSKKVYDEYKQYKTVKGMTFHPNGTVLIQVVHDVIEFVDPNNGKLIQSLEGIIGKIHRMSLSSSGRYLAAAKTKTTIDVWDLNQNRVINNIPGFFPCQFESDGDHLFSMHYTMKLVKWDVKTKKMVKEYESERELIQVLAVSPDGKLLAGAGFMGVVKIWDVESGKMIKKLTGHAGGIYGLDFASNGKWLVSSGMDNTVRIWDVSSGKELQKLGDQTIIISDVQFSPDSKLLASASWDKTIKIYETEGWKLKNTLEGHVSVVHDIDFSHDGKYLASSGGNSVVTKNDNSVIVWDVEKGIMHDRYIGHTDYVFRVEFDAESSRIYSGSTDGTFVVYNADKKEKLATIMSTNDSDFLLLTPDNYYMGSKAALKSVSFRVDQKLYPLEQFDLRLNRPDIIAERIGKTPKGLINAYKYIYQKRLKKMGIKEEDLDGGFYLPTIQFLDKTKIPVISEDEFLTLNYEAEDESTTLDRINVYVNGVPVYGLKGIDVKTLKKSFVSDEIKVPLLEGTNDIQISCLNASGSESLSDRIKVIRENVKTKGDLYLVTIGVSNYKDERFNLTYPSKDANDIMSNLKLKSELYNEIKTKELINGDATKANIVALKTFLAEANPDDAVVIFVAGHGVLNENFDYFFGTYDMDFNDPAVLGLPYEVLEEILAETKAIKKLLIMDTCHSGEVDKDELEATEDQPEPEGDIEFRAAGAGVRTKEGMGVENSAELMQDLFSDLRKGSGATVISSAGGAEYAMESAEWKNGLFTYCLLKGLKSMEADYDKDNMVQISEIRKYVYEQVSSLSQGKQRPTARSENINLDYRVY